MKPATHFLLGAGFTAILAGCMAAAPDCPAPVQSAPLVRYDREFSAKVANQLLTAPPELASVVTDYEKLRCAIEPNLPVCKDLLK